MKIISISINNIRGIRQASFEVGGENFAIAGPNGSGKSAVVDAIDFLLTGEITRLSGAGTKGISLKKHGPHIDATDSPDGVIVSAKIRLQGFDEPVEISRCMKKPDVLVGSDQVLKAMAPIVAFAKRGQHVLTRREILKYVHSESKKRAEEIQELLNISEIEEARKALVSAKNKASATHKLTQQNVDRCLASIRTNAGVAQDDRDAILRVVNHHRDILGGIPITALVSNQLKIQLQAPNNKKEDAKDPNPDLLEKDILGIKKLLEKENIANVLLAEKALAESLSDIRSDPELFRACKHASLIKKGIELGEYLFMYSGVEGSDVV